MINIGKAIYSIITGTTAITAIISNKVFPIVIPENTALPVVVYERNSSVEYTRDGISIYNIDVDITILSEKYSESITIGELIVKAFDNYKGSIQGINIVDCHIIAISETYTEGAYIQKITISIKSY